MYLSRLNPPSPRRLPDISRLSLARCRMLDMFPDPNVTDRTCYAVVSYIPEPLSGFLDRLRGELVPNCFLRAHITILPPRPCVGPPGETWKQLCDVASRFHPFDIELNTVEVFPVSDVIYISVGEGEKELREIHGALNIGGLCYKEPFNFEPHVTLAQDLKPDELDELVSVAKRRWAEYKFGRVFHVDRLTFVKSANRRAWRDLAECKLGYGGNLYQRVFVPEGDPLVLS